MVISSMNTTNGPTAPSWNYLGFLSVASKAIFKTRLRSGKKSYFYEGSNNLNINKVTKMYQINEMHHINGVSIDKPNYT